MKLVTPSQMREMDRRTIEDIGLPGIVLMERASLGAADILVEHFSLSPPARVGFLCGGGNNGGDGLAMARILASRGFEVVIALLKGPSGLSPDATTNHAVCERLGLPIEILEDETSLRNDLEAMGDVDLWCDALFGTGLDRDIEGRYALAIEFLNDQLAPVFSVDIPSGIHGTTGQVMGVAVEAEATATFAYPKLGQALYPGRAHCGELYTIEIGIPVTVANEVGFEALLLTELAAMGHLPPRPPTFHKGNAGRVLVLAGSREKAGAALMTTRAALVSGAGLLTVGTVAEIVPRIPLAIPEAMSRTLLSSHADPATERELADFLSSVHIVAMGPGMGMGTGARNALRVVMESGIDAVVFDADALNLLADLDLEGLSDFASSARVTLTPHPGEMARLCQVTMADIVAKPVEYSRALARRTGAVIVLKIASTVIAAPDGRLAINTSGNPGMATGGMGDALTGIIAARQADIDDPFTAACLAVFAHGAAADEAAKTAGQRGLTVMDLLDTLPGLWRRMEI
ncbi:MAG: NAD(P)H-hydrate dehydratase [Bradymonadaceae bacterium]